MPSVFTLVMNPELRHADPPPLPVDLVRMILAGLGAWTVALIVTWLQFFTGDGLIESVWTCMAGVSGGVLALAWAKLTRPQLGG